MQLDDPLYEPKKLILLESTVWRKGGGLESGAW